MSEQRELQELRAAYKRGDYEGVARLLGAESWDAALCHFIECYQRPSPPARVPLGETFTDERGSIANLLELAEFECDERGRSSAGVALVTSTLGIHGVALITSKSGTERSNHYHRQDYHWLYVLSGEAHYQERAVGAAAYPEPEIFKAGEMFFTPAMREHRVFFPVDTVLLSLSRYSRKHLEHECDVVRVAP